jgi:hypothetical protein
MEDWTNIFNGKIKTYVINISVSIFSPTQELIEP